MFAKRAKRGKCKEKFRPADRLVQVEDLYLHIWLFVFVNVNIFVCVLQKVEKCKEKWRPADRIVQVEEEVEGILHGRPSSNNLNKYKNTNTQRHKYTKAKYSTAIHNKYNSAWPLAIGQPQSNNLNISSTNTSIHIHKYTDTQIHDKNGNTNMQMQKYNPAWK